MDTEMQRREKEGLRRKNVGFTRLETQNDGWLLTNRSLFNWSSLYTVEYTTNLLNNYDSLSGILDDT
jgi:hypothetical protein